MTGESDESDILRSSCLRLVPSYYISCACFVVDFRSIVSVVGRSPKGVNTYRKGPCNIRSQKKIRTLFYSVYLRHIF